MNNNLFDIAFSESSNSYESSLDEGFKKDHGIFYTDLELADSMVKFLRIPKISSYRSVLWYWQLYTYSFTKWL